MTTSPASHDTQRPLTVILLLLAASAFAMSAGALTDLARTNSVTFPWLFPVVLDGSICGVSYAVYHASVTRQPCFWPGVSIIIFTLASVAFNVSHVWGQGPLSYAIHATPPLALWTVLEVLLSRLRQGDIAKRDRAAAAPTVANGATAQAPKSVAPKRGRQTGRVTMAERAKALGKSVRTLYRMRDKGVNV